MKIIIGLGNPEERYEGTRHNVGLQVVHRLAGEAGSDVMKIGSGRFAYASLKGSEDRVVVAPVNVLMNESGRCVQDVVTHWGVTSPSTDLLIVCDDVNLPLGRLRLRPLGSAGGHHGLQSCVDVLGTEEVARLRLGVGGGTPGRDLAAFVLSPFAPEERPIVEQMIERAAEACCVWTEAGAERAMNTYNSE